MAVDEGCWERAVRQGRGVNRTEVNPLEVQVLTDVALPMVHDGVVAWDTLVPDVVQKILLAGIAVDSPADAVALHPKLFSDNKQAQKAFERAGFQRHIPIEYPYRKMSLKSAVYLRGGRGRSWQRAWWINGSAEDARLRLEQAVEGLEVWKLV